MARRIFLGSLILGVLCAILSQTPDPAVFGIHDESVRILFYGGLGLAAGLFGLTAGVSGICWGVTHFADLSVSQRRYLLTTILIVLCAVVMAALYRFYPNEWPWTG